jgi:hypothetical protein
VLLRVAIYIHVQAAMDIAWTMRHKSRGMHSMMKSAV